MPNFSGPLKASPDSLTITRRYFGFATSAPLGWVDRSGTRFVSFRSARPSLQLHAGERGDFSTEIAGRPLDSFAEGIAYKAGDFNWRASSCLGLLDGLRHALLSLFERETLFEQANFLVVSPQAGLDDLLDDIGRLTLRLGGKHAFLTFDRCGIKSGRVDGLRIGGRHVHRHHAAEGFELVSLAG